jgi:hypothetical protein
VFARVSEFQVDPERLDEMAREGVEHVLPALKMQDGYNGGLVLVDRRSGKVLAVTFGRASKRCTPQRRRHTGCAASASKPVEGC